MFSVSCQSQSKEQHVDISCETYFHVEHSFFQIKAMSKQSKCVCSEENPQMEANNYSK